MSQTRRLAAILAADVAGYSRLMGADEEGTHERLKAHLQELVNPKIGEHRGRVVKNTGDGFLAEFASVVDAVRCAVEFQRGMAERNGSVQPDKRIHFRVGINLGDVIVEEQDIFGDQVRDRHDYTFEDLGEQHVKNIARPVRVYVLRADALADPLALSAPVAPPASQPVCRS